MMNTKYWGDKFQSFLSKVCLIVSNSSRNPSILDQKNLYANYSDITISGKTNALGGPTYNAPSIYFNALYNAQQDESPFGLGNLSKKISIARIVYLKHLFEYDSRNKYSLDMTYKPTIDPQIKTVELCVCPMYNEFLSFAENVHDTLFCDKNNDVDPDGDFNLLCLDDATIYQVTTSIKDLVAMGRKSESIAMSLNQMAWLCKKEKEERKRYSSQRPSTKYKFR